jgi:hypothetical protein
MFFRGVEGFPYVILQEYQNYTIRPASTNDTGRPGELDFSLSDTLATDLNIYFTLGGTASNGVDYVFLTNHVTIPAGNNFASASIQGIYSTNWIPDRTLVATLILTNGYLVDPANYAVTNLIADNKFQYVTNLNATKGGIDYDPLLNSLITSGGFYFGGSSQEYDFERIGTNGSGGLAINNWSGIGSLLDNDEVKLAVAVQTAGGFTNGQMFFSNNGDTNYVGELSPDGTVSNLTFATLTNDVGVRGGLYVDRNGIFGGDLIVVTGDEERDEGGGVWRIKSTGAALQLADITNTHLEGVITLTNDVAKWGPWAGKIITGAESSVDTNGNYYPLVFSIDTNGVVNSYALAIGSEDFHLVPTNQDLYCVDESESAILKIPRALLAPYVGNLLITQSGDGEDIGVVFPALYFVSWNNATTNFVITSFSHPTDYDFEHSTFAPLNLPAH